MKNDNKFITNSSVQNIRQNFDVYLLQFPLKNLSTECKDLLVEFAEFAQVHVITGHIGIHQIFADMKRVRLYWCESDIASRWFHKEYNLMFTLGSDKDQRNNRFRSLWINYKAQWHWAKSEAKARLFYMFVVFFTFASVFAWCEWVLFKIQAKGKIFFDLCCCSIWIASWISWEPIWKRCRFHIRFRSV